MSFKMLVGERRRRSEGGIESVTTCMLSLGDGRPGVGSKRARDSEVDVGLAGYDDGWWTE